MIKQKIMNMLKSYVVMLELYINCNWSVMTSYAQDYQLSLKNMQFICASLLFVSL